ncbi:MAG: hypothetical protein QM692_20175 [Thermomicrobiales bacterium]
MRSNQTVDRIIRVLLAVAVLAAPVLALQFSVPVGLGVMAAGLLMLSHVLANSRVVLAPESQHVVTVVVGINIALALACLGAAMWLLTR